jgi:hypothetical protein
MMRPRSGWHFCSHEASPAVPARQRQAAKCRVQGRFNGLRGRQWGGQNSCVRRRRGCWRSMATHHMAMHYGQAVRIPRHLSNSSSPSCGSMVPGDGAPAPASAGSCRRARRGGWGGGGCRCQHWLLGGAETYGFGTAPNRPVCMVLKEHTIIAATRRNTRTLIAGRLGVDGSFSGVDPKCCPGSLPGQGPAGQGADCRAQCAWAE